MLRKPDMATGDAPLRRAITLAVKIAQAIKNMMTHRSVNAIFIPMLHKNNAASIGEKPVEKLSLAVLQANLAEFSGR